MKHETWNHIKTTLLPCFFFSGITGIVTGMIIFLFKIVSAHVISLSSDLYGFVRENPVYLPILIGGAVVIGLLAALLLHIEPNSRGGGIPTAITILRGLLEFRWLKNIITIFVSAMLTYLCGVPLGNEGPSVQMGTAIGRGTISLFGKKKRAWDRYIMTGGACAGFAAATGTPLSGIFFAFEEAHRRFSPMIFMAAATTVIAGTATTNLLSALTGYSISIFDFTVNNVLPLSAIWAPFVAGIICGIAALLFTKVYRLFGEAINKAFARIPLAFKIAAVFAAVSIIGFFSESCIGSGHSLIEELMHRQGIWYMLIVYFCVRGILLIVANNAGATGGLFVPTLAFGAIIGALCADIMIGLGILAPEYYPIMVVIGMVSFMSASSRTPITAITFGAEALCGFSNMLPLIIGAAVSFLVIETLGVESFTDTVIANKVKKEHPDTSLKIIDEYLTVKEGSFAVGKEIRDILWPPSCVVLSIRKKTHNLIHSPGLAVNDLLHIHYQTCDPKDTMQKLEDLLGVQDNDTRTKMQHGGELHQVPEI